MASVSSTELAQTNACADMRPHRGRVGARPHIVPASKTQETPTNDVMGSAAFDGHNQSHPTTPRNQRPVSPTFSLQRAEDRG